MSLATPSQMEAAARRERLNGLLDSSGLDAAAIVEPELIYYLAGVEPESGQSASLLLRGDRAVLVWPGDTPEGLDSGVEAISYDPYARARRGDDGFGEIAANAAHALRLTSCRVGLDGSIRPCWLPGDAVDVQLVFSDLTRQKSASEVAAIQGNLALNDQAFACVAQQLQPGSTDLDVFGWCCRALVNGSQGPVSYAGNIGLGAHGDYFDAQPSGVAATEGASLFVDLYCRLGHYVGDSTRSFSVGPAPVWLKHAHRRLEHALHAVEHAIRPGVAAGDVDRRCRKELERVRDGVFPHHTGHGVGLRPHEPPYLVPGSKEELRAGDVVAVEPGLYFPGRGGIRLEEVFLVTEDAARPLTRYPRTLTECNPS